MMVRETHELVEKVLKINTLNGGTVTFFHRFQKQFVYVVKLLAALSLNLRKLNKQILRKTNSTCAARLS